MARPHTFTEAGAQRIVNVVRRVEGMNFDGRTPPQPKPRPVGQGGFTQWVSVTSATQTAGRHPGTWSSYDVEANSWTENGGCWVVGSGGTTLSAQRYLCRLQGTLAADGLPIFVTAPGSGSSGAGVVSGVLVSGATATVAGGGSLDNMSFVTENFDTGGYWSSGSPTQIVLPSGYWVVGASNSWDASAATTGMLGVYVRQNSVSLGQTGYTEGGNGPYFTMSHLYRLTSSTTFTAHIINSCSINRTYTSGTFWAHKLGDI